MSFLKKSIKNAIGLLGFEIHRKQQGAIPQPQPPRASMIGCLQQAVKNGLRPETVFDVGAAGGTSPLYEVFPDARHILIEPLEEFVPYLARIISQLKNAEYILASATSKSGSVVLNVHPDLVGSSIYREEEDSNVNGVERTVPAITLDEVCREKKTKGPYLIKIDTQGAELEVLKGAEETLQNTEFLILEVSFFETLKGGPLIDDCINFMKDHGFVAYDIFGLQYRLLDGAMSQIDVAFVQEKSKFRRFHFYATREQREAQDKLLRNIYDRN